MAQKKSRAKKILVVLAILAGIRIVGGIVVFALSDIDSSDSDYSSVADTKESSSPVTGADLSVSDFKLNSAKSVVFKMLRSKGWKPGDGDTGEILADRFFDSAFQYTKRGGSFESYGISHIVVSFDQNERLAGYQVVITKKFGEQEQNALETAHEKFFSEVVSNCLTKRGFSADQTENEEGEANSVVFGYKNKSGDVCKLEVALLSPYDMTLTLDYLSVQYIVEERAANAIYGSWR